MTHVKGGGVAAGFQMLVEPIPIHHPLGGHRGHFVAVDITVAVGVDARDMLLHATAAGLDSSAERRSSSGPVSR